MLHRGLSLCQGFVYINHQQNIPNMAENMGACWHPELQMAVKCHSGGLLPEQVVPFGRRCIPHASNVLNVQHLNVTVNM